MTADKDGCESLIALMDALIDSPEGANRTVILGPMNTDLYDITGCRQETCQRREVNIIKSGKNRCLGYKKG